MTITMPPPSQQPSSSSSTTTVVEITVLSAEGLNNYSSYFSPMKPFITLTKLPATPTQGDKPSHVVLMSKMDGGGGGGGFLPSTTWDQKFRVAVDPSFFSDRYSCFQLQLFTKRRIVGPAHLGWCLVPASDICLLPSGSVRYLSYRLRARDGSRGQAILNISVRLEGCVPWMSTSVPSTVDTCQTVIGIPVTAVRGMGNRDCGGTYAKMDR